MKSISKIVAAKAFTSNSDAKQSYRVIGTLDINGKGTQHAIADVDPFIFLDETSMRGDSPWPFPRHPHSGLVAMTYMLSGEMTPWDNRQGKNKNNNRAGGIYYINSGQGIVHEEEPVITGDRLRWLQLWINPGIYSDSLPEASTQMAPQAMIPVYREVGAEVRVVIGQAFNQESPIIPDWPIQYLHILLKPKQRIILPLPESVWQGFIYLLNGQGVFGQNQVKAEVRDCLVVGHEDVASIEAWNTSDTDALEFVFLCGKPHHKPFYKILGGGGALIADTEKNAHSSMQQYEANPDQFGL